MNTYLKLLNLVLGVSFELEVELNQVLVISENFVTEVF